ncbi:MAG: right-handed parallel beta-helix repeat-containing protein [Phycisphaerales bacterium]
MTNRVLVGVLWMAVRAMAQAPDVAPLPIVEITADNTVIDRSCRLVIPDRVIEDADGNGVIHVTADNITIDFDGAALRGSAKSADPDAYRGTAVRLTGRSGVTIKAANASGYKTALVAHDCPGLTIDGGDLSDNYRQRLRSSLAAEDGSDWLFPHNNDADEWATQHGAAIWIKGGTKVTIAGVRVHHGQNGIILDRVENSRAFDNDCSFLSGWGLAMWRCRANLICRNAFDFCIRGYSHGVYNRGQDSAGILMFEQNSENLIAENSITHGGDGIFGFGGKEAIGERPVEGLNLKRRGNNDNIIADNDLSYAAAHGLEMTFSHGNMVARNRFVENAICGVWGGYSNEFLIVENTFERNGDAGYGLERGGINIEHGSNNLVVGNTFSGDAVGVHLWWDNDAVLLKLPGVAANDRGVSDNTIADNSFEKMPLALHLRDASEGKTKVSGTAFLANRVTEVVKTVDADDIAVASERAAPMYALPTYVLVGKTKPVGARASLAGRQNIIMTEWGPWDHTSPLLRPVQTGSGRHIYELRGFSAATKVALEPVEGIPWSRPPRGDLLIETTPPTYSVAASESGYFPYRLTVTDGEARATTRGVLAQNNWRVLFFTWTGSTNPPMPPANLAAWRDEASGATVKKSLLARANHLSLRFGHGGPSDLNVAKELTEAGFPKDLLGVVATSTVPMSQGRWRVKTHSDDGVRVMIDGKMVLENWTHHGPTRDVAEFEIEKARTVDVTVEYFEIGGYAVLEVEFEPLPAKK